MSERYYIVATALGALSLLAVLATVIVCIYFDRSMRVQARGRTQSGTLIEAELVVSGNAGSAATQAQLPSQD
jgi:hypothetical protein